MIEIISTVHSIAQAEKLIALGVDRLYIGEDAFSLRLPKTFTLDELAYVTNLAHKYNTDIQVAVNAMMHNEQIKEVESYLSFLAQIGVDVITVGDPGVVHILKQQKIKLPFIYDAQTLVTNARQINFWQKRGAVGAVVARELTFTELRMIQGKISIPLEVLIYGPTCIHHSKRPLLTNYFRYLQKEESQQEKTSFYLSEAKRVETQYPIIEDSQGTHVFSTYDINLLPYLENLYEHQLTQWKIDGLLLEEDQHIKIVEIFMKAKKALETHKGKILHINNLQEQLKVYQPQHRDLDSGFFLKKPEDIE